MEILQSESSCLSATVTCFACKLFCKSYEIRNDRRHALYLCSGYASCFKVY